jgi:hypothetical protein
VTGVDFLTAELARISWIYGGSEGVSGAKACAFSFRNRVRAGWFGGNWADVLSHHREVAATTEPLPDLIPDPRESGFRTFLQDITNIFSGQAEDTITIAQDSMANYMKIGNLSAAPPPVLYFGRLSEITNPWFLENISRNHAQHRVVASVGTLNFWT